MVFTLFSMDKIDEGKQSLVSFQALIEDKPQMAQEFMPTVRDILREIEVHDQMLKEEAQTGDPEAAESGSTQGRKK